MGLLTSNVILDKMLDRYAQQSVVMQLADGRYSEQWGSVSPKGDTISIRLPMYARGRRGEQADPQTLDERSVQLVINPAYGSDSTLTDRQLSMELLDFTEQILNPHIDAVSSSVARDACKTLAMGISNFVGVPGAIPTSLDTYADAGRLLSQGGTPAGAGMRYFLVNSGMDQKAVAAGRALYNDQSKISRQYTENTMVAPGDKGYAIGGNWYEEEALYQHTVGTLGGTPRVNGGGQSGNSIITDGWTASVVAVLRRGDKLQFGGSAMVHPVLGTIYAGDLQAFTVAADVDSDGGGAATVYLTEAIEFGTPYANVSQLPADNALISVWGVAAAGQGAISQLTFTVGCLMHKQALVYGSPDMYVPRDTDNLSGFARSKVMKVGMRVWRASDIKGGEVITRLDCLVGHLVGQSRRGCLICSA